MRRFLNFKAFLRRKFAYSAFKKRAKLFLEACLPYLFYNNVGL